MARFPPMRVTSDKKVGRVLVVWGSGFAAECGWEVGGASPQGMAEATTEPATIHKATPGPNGGVTQCPRGCPCGAIY